MKHTIVQPEELTVQCMMLSEYIFRLTEILHANGDLPVTQVGVENGHATAAEKPQVAHLAASTKRKFVSYWNIRMNPEERTKSIRVVRLK